MSSLIALGAILSFSRSVVAAASYSYTPSTSVPDGASEPVAPSFAGFGIESSNLFSFTGGSTTNNLSVNLLQNLADYTGTPPHLRIGGNTQDYFIYDSTFTGYNIKNNPNPTVSSAAFAPDGDIIGPNYFTALDRLPKNTPITFGLNLAYENSDYAQQINATASAAVSLLKNVDLVSFEIGNEVDLYLQNGFRTGTWDGSTYTKQWLDRAQIVYDDVLKPLGYPANFFEPGCTASTIGTSFEITMLENDGITADPVGSSSSFVSQWNQHDYYYYIGVSTYTLTMQLFTDLSTTATQFAAWVSQIKQATSSGYRYALREMGVVGPVGEHGITDTFAASLWTLNFFLYAATLNITSVQMHMTDNSNASAWQPTTMYGNDPHVRPNYYAFAAMAQIIGCGGQIQVAGPGVIASGVPSDYTNRIAIYSIYQSSRLQSLVIINTAIANVSETSKPSVTFSLSLPDFANQDLYLSYLTADGSDAESGTTWNGISYEQSSDGTPVLTNSTIQTVTVSSSGSAQVAVRDSQALVVNIGQVIGDNGGNSSSCPVNSATTTHSASPTASATQTTQPTATSADANPQNTTTPTQSSSSSTAASAAVRGFAIADWSMQIFFVMASTMYMLILTI